MSSIEHKMIRSFSVPELAAFLRKLAEDFDKGVISIANNETNVEGQIELKGSLKIKPSKKTLKLKIEFLQTTKGLEDLSSAGSDEKPSGGQFKSIKKSMQKSFKAIKADLEAGNLPPLSLIENVAAGCRSMVEIPGYRDALYPEFIQAVEKMVQVHEAGQVDELRLAIEKLDDMRKSCHSTYK